MSENLHPRNFTTRRDLVSNRTVAILISSKWPLKRTGAKGRGGEGGRERRIPPPWNPGSATARIDLGKSHLTHDKKRLVQGPNFCILKLLPLMWIVEWWWYKLQIWYTDRSWQFPSDEWQNTPELVVVMAHGPISNFSDVLCIFGSGKARHF